MEDAQSGAGIHYAEPRRSGDRRQKGTMKTDNHDLAAAPSTALLACPFCGHEAKWAGENGEHFILCANAHCHMEPVTHSYWTYAEALAAWNTRVDSKANPTGHAPARSAAEGR